MAGMLAVCSLVLFMANRVTEKIEKKSALKEAQARPMLQRVNGAVDTLLERYRIEDRWIKSWSVFTPARKFIREERRIYVPPRFISLDFNHDLSDMLSQYDVRVVATERTKESTVSMHVINDGMIIESLSFVLKRELE